MKRLASIIGNRVERIPTYLDARLKQTEAMASPSSLGFLQKLDLLPESPPATLPTTLSAPPPVEAAEKPAEGFFDKLGKLAEVAAPVAALMGEPEAAAAATVIDEAVSKLQTVLAKPKADKTDSATASSPVRSRVEEVSAGDAVSPKTQTANEPSVASEPPDRSPQAWAARIRKMIEAESGAVERKLPEMPLISAAQTQLAKTVENIGDVSGTLASAIPAVAPASGALGEARRFVAPIADSGSLPQAVQQLIGQTGQSSMAAMATPAAAATAFSPFSMMQAAANVETGIEANIGEVVAPMAEAIESPAAQINQQVSQANEALQQATALPMSAAESVADLAGSVNRRFVPPTVNTTLPAQIQPAISQIPLPSPNSVESLANEAVQSVAQTGEWLIAKSGLSSATSSFSDQVVADEALMGAAGSLLGHIQESIESPKSSPVEALEQWSQAANQVADFSGLFGQVESATPTTAKPKQTEAAAVRDDGDKIKTATRATSARVEPDLDDIARQVYPILKRRLDAERRRELF